MTVPQAWIGTVTTNMIAWAQSPELINFFPVDAVGWADLLIKILGIVFGLITCAMTYRSYRNGKPVKIPEPLDKIIDDRTTIPGTMQDDLPGGDSPTGSNASSGSTRRG